MKKFLTVLLLAAFAAGVSAQEFKINGEVKTGLLWEQTDDQMIKDAAYSGRTRAGSKDDAGSGQGRFRINMEYSIENFGFKARTEINNWGPNEDPFRWPYAFGYGNLLDEQLVFSIGKLGASPWGTGGPEMWKEAEAIDSLAGMRVEIKPQAASGLNVGFVINSFNGYTDMYDTNEPITFLHVLQESVIGAAYAHDLFYVRAAFRFDSVVDKGRDSVHGNDGGLLVYRVEEKLIEQYLPYFNIWALGYWDGLGAHEDNKDFYAVENWLFFQYAPEFLTAQIRLGYNTYSTLSYIHVKPAVYAHLFDRMLKIGGYFWYARDFGESKIHEGSPFYFIEFEPLIQFNITPNSYVAFAYNWRRQYVRETGTHQQLGLEPIKQTQWMNFRVGMTF